MSFQRHNSESMRSRHWSARRLVATLVIMTVVFASAGVQVRAQQTRDTRDYAPRERSSSSPLSKLDALQRSVKERIKAAFRKKPAPETLDQRTDGQFDSPADQGLPIATSANQPDHTMIQPAVGGPLDLPTQTLPQANTLSPALRQAQTQRVQYRQVIDPESIDPSRTVPNDRTAPSSLPNYSQQPSYPQQPMGGQQPFGSAATSNPAMPRYDSGYSQPPPGPSVRGMRLGQSPVTATEHALRLTEENGDLKAQLAALDAENRRLKDKLTDAEQTLDRSATAVETARQEINTLSIENRTLRKQLEDAETKHKRYLLETDRILQSIREELDAVLVREISAAGGG